METVLREECRRLGITLSDKQLAQFRVFGTALLEKRAAEENCDIVLYGHTHVPRIDYIAGRYYLNPGSLRQPAEGHPGYIELNLDGKNTVPIRVEI